MAQNDFSPNQIRTMQEDAITRVREMQRRSQERLRQSNNMMNSSTNYAQGATPATEPSSEANNNSSSESARQATNNVGQGTHNTQNFNARMQNPNFRARGNSSPPRQAQGSVQSQPHQQATAPNRNADSSRDPASALNLIPDSLFTQFNIDKETGIILLLVFLLVKENASTPLVLALCYLLI